MVTPTSFFYFSKPIGILDTEGKEIIIIIVFLPIFFLLKSLRIYRPMV